MKVTEEVAEAGGHRTPQAPHNGTAGSLGGPTGRSLAVQIKSYPPAAVVLLSGELTAENIGELGTQLSALIQAGCRWLSVDLAELRWMSPVCVGVLNRTADEVGCIDGSLAVTGLTSASAAALRLSGVHHSIYLRTVGSPPAMYPIPVQGAGPPPTALKVRVCQKSTHKEGTPP